MNMLYSSNGIGTIGQIQSLDVLITTKLSILLVSYLVTNQGERFFIIEVNIMRMYIICFIHVDSLLDLSHSLSLKQSMFPHYSLI